MLAGVFVSLVLLGVLNWFYGHDSRDGCDWRNYDEALRYRPTTLR
jgi:hypothetical protein